MYQYPKVMKMSNTFHRCKGCAWQRRAIHLVLTIVTVLLFTTVPLATPQSTPPAKGKLTKEELRRQKALMHEFINPYAMWFWFEVPGIVTSEEVSIFKGLTTDDEREEFIEQFWERRNHEPGSLENKFKYDYYRRFVRANELFSAAAPGWKTDRGRIYVAYGPPDEIESHPQGGIMPWSSQQFGDDPVPYPFERWTYRVMDRIGPNQVLIFADPTRTGDYRLVANPECKVVLLPGSRADFMKTALQRAHAETFLKPSHPPAPVEFPDLRAIVNTGKVSANPIPILVQSYAFAAMSETVLTIIAVQIPTSDLHFQNEDGVMHARIDVYGQVQALGGRIENAFEKTQVVDLHADESLRGKNDKFVFEEFVPLRPGRHRFCLALKDEASERTALLIAGLTVPPLDEPLLTSAPLMLADLVEPNMPPTAELDPFAIGNTKVLPNPGHVFSREKTMGAYLQIYNLALDPETHKTNFLVRSEFLKDGKPLIGKGEEDASIAQAATEFTLAKTIPLKSLEHGAYTLQINIADKIGKQTITPATTFFVR
jgi:GWxTD domain-containing protein